MTGREADLQRALALLESTSRLLIEGPAGIGKTSLLASLVSLARERGAVVVCCTPTETEAALPLAALADLLLPVAGDLGFLPEPQQEALRSALLLSRPSPAVDERALAAAARSVLDAAASSSPVGLLVAIDDAPWLDPPSERALRFALRRTSPSVQVVVTRRTADRVEAAPPLELDARGDVARLELAPLDVGPLHHLLTERFGIALPRPTVVRLAREAGGNPLLAIELTRAALRLPQLPGPGDDFPVPVSMHDLVEASLATLPTDSLRGVRLASLLTAPRLGDLAAAGIDPSALDAVESAGLVRVFDGLVSFVHPVHASAVRALMPAGLRRRLHAQLAESVTDRDERARHLARCTSDVDAAVAHELAAAAERVRARGASDLAAEFFDRAAALTPDADAATLLRLRALYCLFDCGSYQLAASRADALSEGLDGDLLAETLLLRAAIAFSVDDLPLATSTALRALESAKPTSRLAGRIHAHLAVFVDRAAVAREHAQAALTLLTDAPFDSDDPRGPGALGRSDDDLLSSVLLLIFLNEVRSGLSPRMVVLEQGLALEAGGPSWLAGTIPAIWWKGIDQHDRARDRLQTMLDLAASAGDEPMQHELMEHLAETEILAGHYDRAVAWIDGAATLASQVGAGAAAGRWLRGTLDALTGDTAAAAAAGAAGLAEAAVSKDPWLRRISLQLVAFCALADGRNEEAAAAYQELASALDDVGPAEPLATRFEPDWLEALVAIGDLTTAAAVLERLAQRHARIPRPWTALGLARSRVLLASAAGHDTTGLLGELTSALAAVPEDVVPFDRARCLLVAGLAHRRARRKLAAREALLAAAATFDALGAPTFAARARTEANRTGARLTTPDGLSSSELRVAELAASGASNREIADALFISAKTVEANLARAYRKLAIRRRMQLAAALADRAAGHS